MDATSPSITLNPSLQRNGLDNTTTHQHVALTAGLPLVQGDLSYQPSRIPSEAATRDLPGLSHRVADAQLLPRIASQPTAALETESASKATAATRVPEGEGWSPWGQGSLRRRDVRIRGHVWLDDLPNEVLLHILGFLDVNDLLATSRVSAANFPLHSPP